MLTTTIKPSTRAPRTTPGASPRTAPEASTGASPSARGTAEPPPPWGRGAARRSDVGACTAVHLDQPSLARVRRHLVDDRTATGLAETFRLLGDPTRVRLLDALAQGELCVCNLASLVGISESAVSHQLRLLRGARLVRPRRHGRLVFYALDDRHILTVLQQGLRHVGEATSVGR